MQVQVSLLLMLLLSLHFAGVPHTVSAQDEAFSSTPRCALIDLENSPLGALLEAELLGRDDSEWLERTEIAKILAERQLQSLLSANATGDRVSLGKTLKADLLIVLRTGSHEAQKYADLVVAETAGGLRLITQRVPLGEDMEADVGALAKLVDQGLAKSREELTHVFAVPPFINQDLTYEYDYLKGTYARLLEQTLLEVPGVLVVELQEAEALAREFQLTEGGGSVHRRLPLYLLGEYRHEGRGEDRQVQLSLRIEQGQKQRQRLTQVLAPVEVPALLRATATKWIQAAGIDVVIAEPEIEARQLATRADRLMRLANWNEALPLIEASLLLNSDQVELISQGVTAASRAISGPPGSTVEDLERSLQQQQRVLFYLRKLVTRYPLDNVRPHFDHFRTSSNTYREGYDPESGLPPELVARFEQFRQERRALTMQLVHRFAQSNEWRTSGLCLARALADLAPRERYAQRLKLILQYQDQQNATGMTMAFARGPISIEHLATIEGRQFLRELKASPQTNKEVKDVVTEMLAAVEVATMPTRLAPHVAEKETGLSFHPVDLTYDDAGTPQKLQVLSACIPLSGGVDLVVADRLGVFTLSPEGKLDRIWQPEARNTTIHAHSYDGRYLWLAVKVHQRACEVWVLDPLAGESWQLTVDDGLPLLGPEEVPEEARFQLTTALSSVEPGRAIVAGFIGRLWLAEVRFDPQGKHQVNIFHEGKDAMPRPGEPVDWKNVHLASPTGSLLTLWEREGNRTKSQRVIVNRNFPYLAEHPLIVDPDDLTVRVMDSSENFSQRGLNPNNVIDGASYQVTLLPPSFDRISLVRTGLPDLKPTIVIPDIQEGKVLLSQPDSVVHVVGTEWFRGKLEEGRLQSFGPVPWYYNNSWAVSGPLEMTRVVEGTLQLHALASSQTFGILAACSEVRGSSGIVQVVFDGSGQSLREVLQGEAKPAADSPPSRSPTSQPNMARRTPPSKENLWRVSRGLRKLLFSPDGKLILTTGTTPSRAIQTWDAESGELLGEASIADMEDGAVKIEHVVFSHAGRYFATGYASGLVVVWDTQRLQPVDQFQGHTRGVNHLCFSWNDQYLASSSDDRTVRLWDIAKGVERLQVSLPNNGVQWVGFTPDDSQVLTSSLNTEAELWDTGNGKRIGRIESLHQIVGYLQDKSLVAINQDAEGSLIRWDFETESYRKLRDRTPGVVLAVSPDGRRCATVRAQMYIAGRPRPVHRLQIWDLETGTELMRQDGTKFLHADFAPHGDTLVTVSQSGATQQWRLDQNWENHPPLRSWTDRTGRNTIVARLLGRTETAAHFETTTGKTIVVPLERLSPEDESYIREQGRPID